MSANVPALGPPAGLSATAQPLADLGSCEAEGRKRGQKQQRKQGRRKEEEKVVTRQQPDFSRTSRPAGHLLDGVGS